MWSRYKKMSFRKQKKLCKTHVSIRSNTILEKSYLKASQILAFCSFWVDNSPLKLNKNYELANCTSVDWSSFCREVVIIGMLKNSELLGNTDTIVEIDELKFSKRKYYGTTSRRTLGIWRLRVRWVFMEIVEDRSTYTLLTIIKK